MILITGIFATIVLTFTFAIKKTRLLAGRTMRHLLLYLCIITHTHVYSSFDNYWWNLNEIKVSIPGGSIFLVSLVKSKEMKFKEQILFFEF